MSQVDPQVEALIRQGVAGAAQPPQAVVTINTPNGPTQVPVPLAMVIILDNILDELKAIRAELTGEAENAGA
jgi:hypothetical protein